MNPLYDYVNKFQSDSKALGLTLLIASFSVIVSSACAFIMYFFDKRRKNVLTIHQETNSSNSNSESRTAQIFNLKDMFKFPIQFWLMIIICVVFFSVTFPFIGLAKLYFIRKYSNSSFVASLQQRFIFIEYLIYV
jgi:hypothetical protein